MSRYGCSERAFPRKIIKVDKTTLDQSQVVHALPQLNVVKRKGKVQTGSLTFGFSVGMNPTNAHTI